MQKNIASKIKTGLKYKVCTKEINKIFHILKKPHLTYNCESEKLPKAFKKANM